MVDDALDKVVLPLFNSFVAVAICYIKYYDAAVSSPVETIT